jgi:putative photosynthetic complex assembly protein 2
LLGYITGSRRVLCPSDAKGWQRAWYAFQTINHHELALLVLGIVLAILHIDAVNTTGLWAFVILWVMRQSAKLNIFLGVLNLNERFLPDHLKYLQTYFRRRPMNYLMPFSVVLAVLVVTPLWIDIFTATESAFALTSKTLLATLLSLGILEHILLVLPFSSEGLWKWGFREGR